MYKTSDDFSERFSRDAERCFHPAPRKCRVGKKREGGGRTAAAAGVARISLPSNPLLG